MDKWEGLFCLSEEETQVGTTATKNKTMTQSCYCADDADADDSRMAESSSVRPLIRSSS